MTKEMVCDVDVDVDGNHGMLMIKSEHQLLRPPVVATLLTWSPPPILVGKLN